MPRNYNREYQLYYGTIENGLTKKQKRHRKHKSSRNMARRIMLAHIKANPGAYYDVDHRDKNPLNNNLSNLRLISKHKNRSIK